MRTDRRAFVGVVATSITTVSGCSEIRDVLVRRKARAQTKLGGTSQQRYIEGQQAFESVPAVDSWLVTDPEWMETNIRWEQLEGEEMSLRRIQRNFDPETLFLTVFVGALPFGYRLGSDRDSHIDNRTIHVYAKATETSVGGQDDPNDPEYTYDYSFILWRLLDDTKQPTEMDFNFRVGELGTDNRTETTE